MLGSAHLASLDAPPEHDEVGGGSFVQPGHSFETPSAARSLAVAETVVTMSL